LRNLVRYQHGGYVLTSKDVTQRVEHTPHSITNGDTWPSQKILNADEGQGFLIGFAPAHHHLCTSWLSKCHSAFIFLRQKQTEQ
jgi:hypothetical protein